MAPGQLSCQISINQHEAEMRVNVNKHRKTRAMGNDIITYVISANQHFASTLLQALPPFPTPPPEHPEELARKLRFIQWIVLPTF